MGLEPVLRNARLDETVTRCWQAPLHQPGYGGVSLGQPSGSCKRRSGSLRRTPRPRPSSSIQRLAPTAVRGARNRPRTAYAATSLMMTGVLDNLAAYDKLLDDRMTVIGPTAVTRSAIEIASGAWWLTEPGIGARAWVCRELALSLGSARRAQAARERVPSAPTRVCLITPYADSGCRRAILQP